MAVKSCGIEVDTPEVLGQDLAEALWCVCVCKGGCKPQLPGITAAAGYRCSTALTGACLSALV